MAQAITDSALAELRLAMVGDVVTPEHEAYDDLRKVWNGDIDRRPAVMALCASVDDVKAALAFALKSDLEIAVRGGSHSYPGYASTNGGLVIDLRRLNRVTVDPDARRVRVQGGAVWSDVDPACQQHGLAVTGGHVTHTGVGGLTLGGGLGHLMRKYGLTSDNLLSAEIVTVDGRVLRAAPDENEDLFWGIRGGGGNFGIATEFEFQLHPLGTTVWGGLLAYTPDKGRALMRTYRDITDGMSDDVNTIFIYMHCPPLPFIPEQLHFQPVYMVVVIATDQAEGERAVAALRALEPDAQMIDTLPYLMVQGLFDEGNQPGSKVYVKSDYFDGYSDEVIDIFERRCAEMPPGLSALINLQLGGAMGRVPDGTTAFGGRQAGFLCMPTGVWEDDADKAGIVAWSRGVIADIEPFNTKGTYINLADIENDERLQASYGSANYQRLRELKTKYDPHNRLRLNQNIKPL